LACALAFLPEAKNNIAARTIITARPITMFFLFFIVSPLILAKSKKHDYIAGCVHKSRIKVYQLPRILLASKILHANLRCRCFKKMR
jgi:hypothetical protein